MPDIRKLTLEIYWDANAAYEDREESPRENALNKFLRQAYKGLNDLGYWDGREPPHKDWFLKWEIDYDQKWPDIDESEYFEDNSKLATSRKIGDIKR